MPLACTETTAATSRWVLVTRAFLIVRGRPVSGTQSLAARVSALLVGDLDDSSEADDEVEAKLVLEELVELVVPEASVGKQGDLGGERHHLAETLQQRVLVLVPPVLQLRLHDRLPQERCRPAVLGDQVQRDGGLVVPVEVGPVERYHDLGPLTDDERYPVPEELPNVHAGVREEPVHLLDGVFPVEFLGDREGPAQRTHRELGTLQRAHRGVREGCHSLLVKVVVEDRGDEGVHAARADGLSAHEPRTMIPSPRNFYSSPRPMSVGMRGSVSIQSTGWAHRKSARARVNGDLDRRSIRLF